MKVPPAGRRRGAGISIPEELERDHITTVPALTGWRVSGDRWAARLLGMKPTALEARMKKLGTSRRK